MFLLSQKCENRLKLIFILTISSFLLLSCVSSDGESFENGFPDITPPTVLSTSPKNSETSVSITNNISVTFSETMNPKTLTTNTNDNSCSGTLQISSDNFSNCVKMLSSPSTSNTEMRGSKTFTVTPTDNLSYLTTYNIRVMTSSKDSSGNVMKNQWTTSEGFTTCSSEIMEPTCKGQGLCVNTYSSTDCSWVLVAFENAGYKQNLRFLETKSTCGPSSCNIGPDVQSFEEILIEAGDKYYKFKSGKNIFKTGVDKNITIDNFKTNDTDLNNYVQSDGGIVFCKAANLPTNSKPGDTSWGLIPIGSSHRSCGCNDGSWRGYGAYYGGTQSGHTSCAAQGGGWSGFKTSGQNKGNGGYLNVDLKIYVN